MPNAKKIEDVKELNQLVGRAQAMLLADYRGLTVEKLDTLRTTLRKNNSVFRVVKNRLLKIALTENGSTAINEQLKGPTGVAFGFDDPVALAKLLLEFEKANEKFQIKSGLLGKALLDVAGIQKLSKMPGLKQLRGQLAGALKGPIRKMPVVINKPAQKLAYAFNNLIKKMESSEAVEG